MNMFPVSATSRFFFISRANFPLQLTLERLEIRDDVRVVHLGENFDLKSDMGDVGGAKKRKMNWLTSFFASSFSFRLIYGVVR